MALPAHDTVLHEKAVVSNRAGEINLSDMILFIVSGFDSCLPFTILI